jgi:alcohol dehydrogenase
MIYLLEHCPVNPTLEYAQELVKKIPKGCTEIVSRGGGSTIDVGKWVTRSLNLVHTAIPTTAGTGSEVTRYCVLTVDGKKTTYTADEFIPDYYVLDPKLLTTLPELHTISSGLDALSQSLESLWSKNSTPESRDYSLRAIDLILKYLPISVKNPLDENARLQMLISGNFSGMAINITKTNVCHAISYPLTDKYNIPHGIACSLSLAYFTQKSGLEFDIKGFLEKFSLPKYEFDKKEVADIAIQSEKLKDFPGNITYEDLFSCYM